MPMRRPCGCQVLNAAAGLLRPSLSLDVVRPTLLGAANRAGEWYRPGRVGIDRIARDMADLVFAA